MKANGVSQEETISEEDIIENNNFTGYHKKITIKDYKLVKNDNNKQPNRLKEITVEISYKLAGKDKNIKISAYIVREKKI